jgi:hypothetical protein
LDKKAIRFLNGYCNNRGIVASVFLIKRNILLEKFVMEDKIREISTNLLVVENDSKAINILKEIISIGDLKKLRVFLKCQRRDIGNNFAVLAIYKYI